MITIDREQFRSLMFVHNVIGEVKTMGLTVAQKIIQSHILEGSLEGGSEIGIRMDQTLTQDSTGTMAYLQFESMGIPRVKTELSLAYIDHNLLQTGFENADDHAYIKSIAKKSGIRYSRAGNGICHHVHLERFALPGKTLIGSDSHTPTAGGIGSLAIGAGGLDVAVCMGGGPYYIESPKILGVNLKGSLNKGVSAKDIILEMLRRLTVKGGVGKIVEYFGEGVKTLSVPERAIITNMGAELGATSSIFPSDENTLQFLKAQRREADYIELKADDDCIYDEIIEIDLSTLVPLVALPHMPDNVKTVKELEGLKIDQVCIGSCTNSSLYDLMTVAAILKGSVVKEGVSVTISPGSRQILRMLAETNALSDILVSGVRLLECGCGPCIGMGQSPSSGAVSLRTFNRNFEGRSGTKNASVYLVSPETAAVSALFGELRDPRDFVKDISVSLPDVYSVNDNMIDAPSSVEGSYGMDVVRGPNIKEFPSIGSLSSDISAAVSIKVENNVTTDHIAPSDAKLLPFRSNIPYLSDFSFAGCDKDFPKRAREYGISFVIAGENYGQGSSREHAALVPLYLGVRMVVAKSFARIHRDNLSNTGILPMVFKNPNDYERISQGDILEVKGIAEGLKELKSDFVLNNRTKNETYPITTEVSDRQKKYLLYGGLLAYTKSFVTQG